MTTRGEVLDRLYRAATTPGHWESALAAITEIVGGFGTHFLIKGDSVAGSVSHVWNIPDDSADYYNRELLTHDPRYRQFFNHPRRRVVFDYAHSTEPEIRRDPVYAWREKYVGCRYYLALRLLNMPCDTGYFATQFTTEQGHASRRDIRAYTRLAPHMQRAVEIAHRLDHQALWEENDLARLDAKGCGLALLNAAGEIVEMNETLRGFLARADGLVYEAGQVLPRKATDRRSLIQDLKAVLSATDSSDFAAPPMRAIEKRGCPHPYLLTVAPLKSERLILDAGHPRAMLVVTDPTAVTPLDTRRMALAFALTPQECRVAERLWQGETPGEIAAALELSLETVRVHLKALRRKTLSKNLPQVLARLAAFT